MYHGLGATHFDETVQTVPVLGLGASFLHPRLDIVERHRGICFTVSGDLHHAKELAVLTDSDQPSGGTCTKGRSRRELSVRRLQMREHELLYRSVGRESNSRVGPLLHDLMEVSRVRQSGAHSREKTSVNPCESFSSADPDSTVDQVGVYRLDAGGILYQFGSRDKHQPLYRQERTWTYLIVSLGVTAIIASSTPAPKPASTVRPGVILPWNLYQQLTPRLLNISYLIIGQQALDTIIGHESDPCLERIAGDQGSRTRVQSFGAMASKSLTQNLYRTLSLI